MTLTAARGRGLAPVRAAGSSGRPGTPVSATHGRTGESWWGRFARRVAGSFQSFSGIKPGIDRNPLNPRTVKR